MRLSIIIIGDEILIGQVTDTNSGVITRTLNPDGWDVGRIMTVGDDRDSIANAINLALSTSDLVITTGGLGPTKDDITKTVMTEIFGGDLVKNNEVLENIRQIFDRRGLKLNPLTEAQALVPTSCKVIQNRFGTAPIMWFENNNKVLVAMPGVPFETEGMLPEVARQVKTRFAPSDRYFHSTIIVSGISESALAALLNDYEDSLPKGLHLAYLPVTGYIRLRLDGVNVDSDLYNDKVCQLKQIVGHLMIADYDATPAEIVLRNLAEKQMTLATAESCTGGNIAHQITLIPGSSATFLGSIVSYANSVKESVLAVSTEDIKTYGAVSKEVVEQMARGACCVTGANCAIATSGIAGPGGGTEGKPVGTVWVAWCVNGVVTSRLAKISGNRSRIIARATDEALIGLLKLI